MEKDQLIKLGSNFEDYRNWKSELEANIVDTLMMFPSVKISAATLISNIPKFYDANSCLTFENATLKSLLSNCT